MAAKKELIQVTTPTEPQSPFSSPERTSSSSRNTEGAPGQTPTQKEIGIQFRDGPAQQRKGCTGSPRRADSHPQAWEPPLVASGTAGRAV